MTAASFIVCGFEKVVLDPKAEMYHILWLEDNPQRQQFDFRS